MRRRLDRLVFRVENEEFRIRDAVLYAALHGDWQELERTLRRGLACQRRAAEGPHPLSMQDLETSAAEFRYRHDLISRDALHAWLRARELDASAWKAFLARTHLRQRWRDEIEDIEIRFPVAPDALDPHLWAESVCSGRMESFCRELAGAAALRASYRSQDASPNGASRPAIDTGRAGGDRHDLTSLDRIGIQPADDQPALERLVALEPLVARTRERVLTAEAIRDCIAANHVSWIELRGQQLTLPSESAAREARLRMLTDGESLAAVAEDLGTAARAARFVIEDLAPGDRDGFVAAAPGELVGPYDCKGVVALFCVGEKRLPQAEDPEARARAIALLWEQAMRREIARWVKWEMLL